MIGRKRMRLIDADKLVEICRKGWKLFGRDDEKLKHWVDENDIREQPTIDAIPVEWVKEELKKEEYRTFLVDYIEWGNCLRWLLEKWEQENETY